MSIYSIYIPSLIIEVKVLCTSPRDNKELTLYLTEVFTIVVYLRYYLKIKKSITTVALYKDSKVDYFFINSYRPITLKNTIVKVYKKLLVTLIF